MDREQEKIDEDLKEELGYFISKCKPGHGIQLITRDGQKIYFNVMKIRANQLQVFIKAPKDMYIKKTT